MKYEVIGVTNDVSYVPQMLGVKSEAEIYLCESTLDGQFYARLEPEDRGFGPMVVRVISSEECDRIERRVMKSIEAARKKAEAMSASVPHVDMQRFDSSMAEVQQCVKEASERITASIKRRSEW